MFKAGLENSRECNSSEEILSELIKLEISIHALCGSPDPKNMRFMGYIGRKVMVILIDTASTRNFIDSSVIQGAKLSYNIQELLKIRAVNGQTVSCEGNTEALPLHMQGYVYAIDFYILTLGHST